MKISKIKIKVFGIVQGVFFRFSTGKFARKLGLIGYVKNLPDGTVYIEAEGPEENLYKLLEFSKQGPKYAKVEKVEYELNPATNEFKEFNYEF